MVHVSKELFRTVITVSENQRALVLQDGKFVDILRPGKHTIFSFRLKTEIVEFDLAQATFNSPYLEALTRELPEVVNAHLVELKTERDEAAVINRNGRLHSVQGPEGRSYFWRDAGEWTFERFDASEDLMVPADVAKRLARHPNLAQVKRLNVEHGQAGLLYVDNAFVRVLKPGAYAFWNVGRPVVMKVIDTREQALDVPGQEILTRDRVSIRVNLAAKYRVTDPVKAATQVTDFVDALYRALQHAFRLSLGSKTLDAILSDKVSVDAQAAKTVRKQMAECGVEVGEIAVKDVILPGDMRDILNGVVQAEKEAEANVIRRREETSATRSLLNTAKVMAENPVMLRLKELEALENVADKVQNLTVHNGTQGLLQDIVTLRGDAN